MTVHFIHLLNLNVNWLDLQSLWKVIPIYWKTLLRNNGGRSHFENGLFDKLRQTPDSGRNRKIYDMLIDDEDCTVTKYANRWLEQDLSIDCHVFKKCFINYSRCTKITKFRDFQYRLLLDKIVLNERLFNWGIVEDKNCTLCKAHPESVKHIFFTCVKVAPLLEYFYSLCESAEVYADRSLEAFVFNFVVAKPEHIMNFIAILLKQYIYRQRCRGECVWLPQFIAEIDNLQDIEYVIAQSECKIIQHVKKWSPVYEFN